MLGIASKVIDNKIENTIITLYKSVFCPQNEYYVQLWPPHLKKKKKDISEMEKAQRKTTRMIKVRE